MSSRARFFALFLLRRRAPLGNLGPQRRSCHQQARSSLWASATDASQVAKLLSNKFTDVRKMGTCFSLPGGEDFVEVVACREDELVVGELKEVKLDEHPCVVVKDEKGRVNALSGKCTHYGANLAKGSYANGVIRCPWHGACFSATTGDIEDFPGLDSLQVYQVRIDAGEVKVRAKKSLLGKKHVKPLCKRDADKKETIVVIGGGAAAQSCVETLRQDNRFTGRLVLVTKEANLPYDRPKLSKALNSTADEIRLRDPAYYESGDIEVMTEMEVTGMDSKSKEVRFKTGDNLKYDKLILATGSSPRSVDVAGKDLKNIFLLRTPEDANAIAKAGKDKNVVIVGSSFIGMEVASFFADKAESVTVIGSSTVPFEKSLGKQIGKYLQSLHEKKKVKFIMEDSVSGFVGNDGSVTQVTLKSDKTIPADVVVLGVGIKPNSDFLKDSGIDLDNNGFIKVNKHLETNLPDVFAAGDVTVFPLACAGGEHVSIGHWQQALAHGRCAAFNVVGETTPIASVPFFWTTQFGKSVRYAGYAAKYDNLVIDGVVDDGEFAAYFCEGEKVLAVATLAKDPVAAEFANTLGAGKQLNKTDLKMSS